MKTNIPVLTRRQMLKFGALTLSGFELLPMLRPFAVKASEKANARGSADYCIFVFLQGGPSHIDSFDLKEGRWTPQDFDVRTIQPGVRIPVGLYPKLSRTFDRFAVIRSLEAWESEHGRATYYMHVAHPPSPARAREMPALGAVVAYEFQGRRKSMDYLPPFVSMNYGTDQVKEGCLDSRFAPLNLDTKGDLPFIVSEAERGQFGRRTELLNQMNRLTISGSATRMDAVKEIDVFRRDALDMLQSPEIPKVMRVNQEDRSRYGSTTFGDACILARNILAADAGTHFIAINQPGWDFHTNIYDKSQRTNHYTLSRDLDSGLSELLGDLEKLRTRDGRSVLERTLVVCLGEFGRTVGDLTVGKGRDHHRFAMSGLFAGGGVAGGRTIGETDDQGAKVIQSGWSKKRSIYPEDVAATIYSALGIDWTKKITNTPSGRTFEYVEPQSGTDFLEVGEIRELFG